MPKPSPREQGIDRLYQLPLDDFVAARTQLAKELGGADARDVRTLAKPNIVAWALNQLYWSARPAYDGLVEATAQLREAQASGLLGRPSDLRGASAAHREAVNAALKEAVAILGGAGHEATPDTIRALTAAFEALPWEEPGRLVRPPAPSGFAALAGMPLGTGREEGRRREAEGRGEGARQGGEPTPRGGAGRETKSARDRAARQAAERARAREVEERRQRAREAVDAARGATAAASERVRDAGARIEQARAAERAAREQLEAARRAVKEAEAGLRQAERDEAGARAALRKAEAGLFPQRR